MELQRQLFQEQNQTLETTYGQWVRTLEGEQGEFTEIMLDRVGREVQRTWPSRILIEAAPLYAIPHPELQSQAIDHPSAMTALYAGNVLQDFLSQQYPVEHWVMVDDVNNGADQLDLDMVMQGFQGVIEQIPLYRNIDHIVTESNFRVQEDDTCAIMDARFQYQKLQHATENFQNVDISNLQNLPLLINIHPREFETQQAKMMENIFALMKGDPSVSHIPKNTRRNLVMNSFLHVWTHEDGSIVSTRPQMVDGVIKHRPITSW